MQEARSGTHLTVLHAEDHKVRQALNRGGADEQAVALRRPP